MLRCLYALPLSLVLASGWMTASHAGPAMSSSLQSTELDQVECVTRAENTIRQAGMTRNIEAFQASVYGEQGRYTALIRCASANGLVFFVVAGPRPQEASKFMSELRENF